MATAFRTFAITEMVVATIKVVQDVYEQIMAGTYLHEILYESEAGALAQACKQIASEYVYVSNQVLKREIMGRAIIFDLLDLYWEAAQQFDLNPSNPLEGFPAKIYSQISGNYRRVFKLNMEDAAKAGIPPQYFRMQLVTDQVSGMTDSFAATLHRELTNA
jgi:dGTPase